MADEVTKPRLSCSTSCSPILAEGAMGTLREGKLPPLLFVTGGGAPEGVRPLTVTSEAGAPALRCGTNCSPILAE
jgi:hypothetical protein